MEQQNTRAFVIDDDEVFGEMLCKMLRKLEIEPIYYNNPSIALDDVNKLNPEIIFLDFKMPQMNGDTFMIKFSERVLFTAKRVILVTSLEGVKEQKDMYRSLGIENVLKKPVSFEAIKRVIDDHKKEQALRSLYSKKIAVIDDEELGAKILMKGLAKRNINCSYYSSGESFLNKIRENENVPDLILLDVLMPGLSGIGVLRNIREKYKPVELPVIMLTSKDEASDIIEALQFGANDYITKPANAEVAIARIKTQLEFQNCYKDSLKKMEIETLNAMIVTYNHEINNPLTIALGNLQEDVSKMSNENLEKVKDALNRISIIVKSIRKLTDEEISYNEYASGQKVIKVK